LVGFVDPHKVVVRRSAFSALPYAPRKKTIVLKNENEQK
jgi:hypothetical protein